MSRKPDPYNQIMQLLHELKVLFPTYNVGRHLATATADYGDVWGMTDKEFLFALQKYKSQLEMDGDYRRHSVDTEEDIESILRDGENLSHILNDSEDGDF